MTECPHERYRDVETCPTCEAEEERDEAREAAREYLAALLALSALTSSDGCENIRSEFLEEERKKHPWLKGKV